MTHLQRKALARTAISTADVGRIYERAREPSADESHWWRGLVRELCESHERLRAEAEGLMVLYEEAKAKLRELGVDA